MRYPLFAADRDSLLAALRLSSVSPDSDASKLIDHALMEVRIGLFDTLGEDRVTEIKETEISDEPSTKAEIARLRAVHVEVAWCKMLLLRSMPIIFRDSADETLQSWNEEALTREAAKEKAEEMSRLQNDITKMLTALVDGTSKRPSFVQGGVIEADCDAPRPGATVGMDWRRPPRG